MNNIIISAIGVDRPGIVSELSSIITNHGGNVEESKMTRLGSDFAIIMLVAVKQDWADGSLEIALQAIDGLTIITKSTNKKTSTGTQYQIDLSGADNEGIVNVLSKYLVNKTINILDMETYISNAPITGTPLFNLRAIAEVKEGIKSLNIQTDLNQISKKLGVEIVAIKLVN